MTTNEKELFIAEFMLIDGSIDSGEIKLSQGWFIKDESGIFLSEHGRKPLNYTNSWDWLMPVVKKAEGIRLNASISESQCDNTMELIVNNLQQVDINGVVLNLISFIEWYNELNKTK